MPNAPLLAPSGLEPAQRLAVPFGSLSLEIGSGAEEWLFIRFEGPWLKEAQKDDLFQRTVDRYAGLNHRAVATPHLILDRTGRSCGLGYPIQEPPAERSQSAEQYAAYFQGTILNGPLQDFLRRLCDALQVIHRYLAKQGRAQVGHGLLVPATIAVLQDRSLRIAGVGLVDLLHRLDGGLPRRLVQDLGQQAFVAPEVLAGATQPDTLAGDFYSAAALTYLLGSNMTPGSGNLLLEHINRNISPITADILRRCMRPKPHDRFANVEELVRALDIGAEATALPLNVPFASNEALLSPGPEMTPAKGVFLAAGLRAPVDIPPEIDDTIPLVGHNAKAPPRLDPTMDAEPAMLLVPAGPVLRGSLRGASDEKPRQLAYLDAFYIARTAITAGAFAEFLDLFHHKAEAYLIASPQGLVQRRLLRRERFRVPPGAEKLPANNVTWAGAVAYAEWLSKETGRTYRLPTEAEWERATQPAWGNGLRVYPWGDDHPTPRRACYSKTWQAEGLETLAPVDRLPDSISPTGALQLAGNVWEWCSDVYDRAAYDSGLHVVNPKGPADGPLRVCRGGSWMSGVPDLRAARRRAEKPQPETGGWIGFRLAMSLPPEWTQIAATGVWVSGGP